MRKKINKKKSELKTFVDFLNEEASLKGNVGIPGEAGKNKGKEPGYLSSVERTAAEKNRRENAPFNARRMGPEFEPLIRQLMDNVERSKTMQRGKEKQLEDLAEKIIRSNYGSILENVGLDIKIVRPGSIDMGESEEKDQGFNLLEPLNDPEVKLEIDKRKIANNITQGEGKNTKHILHLDECKDGLIEIFGQRQGEEIFRVYDNITKAAEKMDWALMAEVQQQMWKEQPEGFAGKVKVEFPKKKKDDKKEEDIGAKILKDLEEGKDIKDNKNVEEAFKEGERRIIARGVDFVMLIHETVKGIYELISAAGIPADAEVAKLVILNADVISNEIEDLRFGPYIAADLRDFVNQYKDINKYPNMREIFYGYIVDKENMATPDFLDLMKGILMKTPEARKKVDDILAKLIEDFDKYEYELAMSQHGDSGIVKTEREERYEEDENVMDQEDEKEATPDVEEKPKEVNYATMRQGEIQRLVDKALDDGDFEEVKKLSKFLKESVEGYIEELDRIFEYISNGGKK